MSRAAKPLVLPGVNYKDALRVALNTPLSSPKKKKAKKKAAKKRKR